MTKQKSGDIDKAKEVLNRHSDELKKKCGVEQMGVGYKIESGKLTEKIALIFYVMKKKTSQELAAEGIMSIPEEIEGFPTDVVEIPTGFKPRKGFSIILALL